MLRLRQRLNANESVSQNLVEEKANYEDMSECKYSVQLIPEGPEAVWARVQRHLQLQSTRRCR
jgi:hypothetical protein